MIFRGREKCACFFSAFFSFFFLALCALHDNFEGSSLVWREVESEKKQGRVPRGRGNSLLSMPLNCRRRRRRRQRGERNAFSLSLARSFQPLTACLARSPSRRTRSDLPPLQACLKKTPQGLLRADEEERHLSPSSPLSRMASLLLLLLLRHPGARRRPRR